MTPEEIMKAVMFFLSVAGAGWAIWWKIDGRVEKVEKAANERIKAAEEKADKAIAGLAEHQLHSEERYATKAGMEEQTNKIMRAMETFGNRLDSGLAGLSDRLDSGLASLSGRMDRLYENPPRRTTTRG
jgi:hypothetical protein